MPGPLIPHKSGVHRVACFALYRALLRQKSKLPIPERQKKQYEGQIKSRIRENSRLQGHWDIAFALRLGYETLAAVQDENRRETVLSRVTQLPSTTLSRNQARGNRKPQSTRSKLGIAKLSSAPLPGKHARDDKKPQSAPSELKDVPKTTTTPPINRNRLYPPKSPVLDRPYPQISGRRHVPKFVEGNRIPFLRIKKPQSPVLSDLIRHAVEQRDKRTMRSRELRENIINGKREDEWDRILELEFGVSGGLESEPEPGSSWQDGYIFSLDEIKSRQAAAHARRMSIAKQMSRIVEKEQALALQEEHELLRKKLNRTPDMPSEGHKEKEAADIADGIMQKGVTTGVGSEDSSPSGQLQPPGPRPDCKSYHDTENSVSTSELHLRSLENGTPIPFQSPATGLSDVSLGQEATAAGEHGFSTLQRQHQFISKHGKTSARIDHVSKYDTPHHPKNDGIQQRGEQYRQSSTFSRSHLMNTWGGGRTHSTISLRSTVLETKQRRRGMPARQYLGIGKEEGTNVPDKISKLEAAQTPQPEQVADDKADPKAHDDAHAKDGMTRDSRSLGQAVANKKKHKSLQVRWVTSKIFEGQKYWDYQRGRYTSEVRHIVPFQEETQERAQEGTQEGTQGKYERHRSGEPVDIRKFLRRDVPGHGNPFTFRKRTDGGSKKTVVKSTKAAVAQNRIGVPVLRKVFTRSPAEVSTDDEPPKPEGVS